MASLASSKTELVKMASSIAFKIFPVKLIAARNCMHINQRTIVPHSN